MKLKVIAFSLTFLFIIAGHIFPETIELTDGKRIVGKILQETDDAVVVSKSDGGFVYSILRTRIVNIRESTTEELGRERRRGLKSGVPVSRVEKKRLENLKKLQLERYERQVELAKKSRGRVKIKFVDDQFGIVEALINGKVKAHLLADTGATLVYISRDLANRLGITEEDTEGKIHAQLADGSITTDDAVTLKSIKVGTVEVRNVKAAIAAESPVGRDGLLGMSFLGEFDVKMDSDENCLYLEKY